MICATVVTEVVEESGNIASLCANGWALASVAPSHGWMADWPKSLFAAAFECKQKLKSGGNAHDSIRDRGDIAFQRVGGVGAIDGLWCPHSFGGSRHRQRGYAREG